ncbi:hypothetical protein RF11_14167 [Thelohanellus kitauei]|uniref:Uncharacterized protein n=1 Tax=Thelohanellus kitauei TaxID=669202 RepID=A0A0C2MJS8_THEKT|nr:hypothetical protein RF11_14167 [Thelohanellus kitauei]
MKRTFYNGEKVLVKNQNPTKLERLFEGSYEVIKRPPVLHHAAHFGLTKSKLNPPQPTRICTKKRNFASGKDESVNAPRLSCRIRKEVPRSPYKCLAYLMKGRQCNNILSYSYVDYR